MSRVAIVGCGAMGSVYAGLMQDAGNEVHAVCHWPDHAAAVAARGMRVSGFSGDRTVRLASMSTSADQLRDAGPMDLVVIATKTFDVAEAARSVSCLVGPRTVVQTIQNGLGAPELVARTIDPDRIAVGVVGGFGASVPEPGHVHHHGMELVRFGSYAGLPERDIERSADVWRRSGFSVHVFADVTRMVWEKLIMNVAFSGTTCITGMTIGQVMVCPEAWTVALGCCTEALAVAEARGIRLDVGDPVAHVRALGAAIPGARPSMLLDASLRRRCEVDAINGAISAEGRRTGVPTPVNDVVADLIRSRESRYLSSARDSNGPSRRRLAPDL